MSFKILNKKSNCSIDFLLKNLEKLKETKSLKKKSKELLRCEDKIKVSNKFKSSLMVNITKTLSETFLKRENDLIIINIILITYFCLSKFQYIRLTMLSNVILFNNQ